MKRVAGLGAWKARWLNVRKQASADCPEDPHQIVTPSEDPNQIVTPLDLRIAAYHRANDGEGQVSGKRLQCGSNAFQYRFFIALSRS